MYLSREVLGEVERRWGAPELAEAEAELAEREFELVARCARQERAHDVTLMIVGGDGRLAVIRKPSYPPEVFRPPSGGIEPGEAFETGALREAREETGLEVRLERYLLRVQAKFHCAGASAEWTTHVVSAAAIGGELEPQDRKEIAEARWATVAEIVEGYRPRMLAMGSAGMAYRVDLQDAALRLMGLADPPAPEGGRTLRTIARG
jgi:ADP-ribose pyrophosphatase YjhB (NUDIX family)